MGSMSPFELNSVCCGPSLSKFGSMSWCINDVGECYKTSSFFDNSGTLSCTILYWVDMCVWRLGSRRNTQSEILIICPAILRNWLLASELRSPIL